MHSNLLWNKRLFSSFCKLLVFIFLFSISFNTYSKDAHHENNEEKFDAGRLIISHIVDAYEWHIATIGDKHISIYLPVILIYEGKLYVFSSKKFHHGHDSYMGFRIANDGPKKGKIIRVKEDGITPDPNAGFILDISITKNVVGIFVAFLATLIIFLRIAQKYKKRGIYSPKGIQSLFEPLIIFIRDEVAKPAIGEKHYLRFTPFLLTLFFFILMANLIGLIPIFPGGANITGNLAVTGTLALFTFITLLFSGKKEFYKHIFNTPGVPWYMKLPVPIMPVVELLGLLTKPIVLMIRLFANITAGHIVSLGFITLIFIFASKAKILGFTMAPISIIFYIFITLLELLVAFVQAYVFTILSALYFGMAVEEHEHHEEHH